MLCGAQDSVGHGSYLGHRALYGAGSLCGVRCGLPAGPAFHILSDWFIWLGPKQNIRKHPEELRA